MHLSFSKGDHGIWILHRGTGGYYYVRRPDNFLPKSQLANVEDAVQYLEEQERKGPRITVQRRDEIDEGYEAFLADEEAPTHFSGRTKAEAIGKLLLNDDVQKRLGLRLMVSESPPEMPGLSEQKRR